MPDLCGGKQDKYDQIKLFLLSKKGKEYDYERRTEGIAA
jgi:hypothetical protein